ncbi:putative membrane protein DUF2207 [Kribbella steppae]|uniref:Putative membrane protein DUF2207 n=1 Tax=Kribbella steppae TaxID=2512223 RepID=A0A4R2HWV2_9ACTN|nr:DUF2207 domain-containing protein [Kribbella steppae]TCO34545.1 putative membrane protein DUF2207 [Kribbella steppae]
MAGPVAKRRKQDAVLLLAGVIVVGLVGQLCAVLGQNGERVARMWVAADIRGDGTARITEVLDYDFAGENKHGIYRTVPQDSRGDLRDVSVTMDGAKVPFRVDQGRRARIVIGDPAATVTGTHRYRIEYTLPRLGDGEWLAWDAVGTEWEVPIGQVQVHLAAPYAMKSVLCVAGSSGSDDACAAMEQPLPGQLDATHGGLGKGQGMTLCGQITDSGGGGGARLPDPPTGPAPAERGGSVLLVWLWVTGIALAAAVVVAELLRLAGRERVQGADGRIRRMDIGRLARSVQPSAVPPAGIGPARGGILLTDRVRKHHLVGWLLGAGLDGYLRVTGVSHPVLRRSEVQPGGADKLTMDVLGALFAGNPNVSLRKYNRHFSNAWTKLRRGLRSWRRSGGDGLWVRGGEQLRLAALVCGALAIVAGVIVLIVTAGDIAAPGTTLRTPTAVGAALGGAGLAAMLRAWELRARTTHGSELWCQVEAYRRHLAGIDRWDGRDEDLLTAWAVALGETRAWLAAAERAADSSRSSSSRQTVPDDHVRWQLAMYMPIAAHGARSHTGSSSGDSTSSGGYSGGGSSGGAGGGSGGGGGGSW